MSDSGSSTPRFTTQAATAEDLLKNSTVGLVQLDEFRKRRRDVQELQNKEAHENSDGTLTPRSEDDSVGTRFKKKKRKVGSRGLLSFGVDDEEETANTVSLPPQSTKDGSNSFNPIPETSDLARQVPVRKLTPNPRAGLPPPKVVTKAAVAAENAERERLRKEFLEVQEKVRSSEVSIPFVFYDGSNIPGGTVKMKKGDHIWLFLERCRKVGAEMGVGGDRGDGGGIKKKMEGKKSWARIGVDDLLCVRGEIIIPHHYELYYFIANQVKDPTRNDHLLFDYQGTSDYKPPLTEEDPLLRRPKDEKIEGHDDDPTYTKVVDRRWYERNKHIFPSSMWKEYKAGKEFEDLAKGRKDAQGNSFFFS